MNLVRALRGLLGPVSLDVKRPQGDVALAGKTALAIVARGTGRLRAGAVSFFVDGSFDGLVFVDVARSEAHVADHAKDVVVEFKGKRVVVPLTTLTLPTPPPSVRASIDVPELRADVPRFAIPLPPSRL